MMVAAVNDAAQDAVNSALLKEIESVRVIRGIWDYRQPAGYVASQLGVTGAETVGTQYGGNMVQSALSLSALDILNGDKSLIVLTGAEFGNTQAKAAKAGIELTYKHTVGEYDRLIGSEESVISQAEEARGIGLPVQLYPMFENALRHQAGESIAGHQKKIAKLWESFAVVAKDNPHAWIRDAPNAQTIATPGPKNRMISFPYPKLMNSNNAVDMAAAIVLCSVQKAKALGIDESRWVYPWAGTDAHDTYYVSARDNLYSSPAIRCTGTRVLELTGLTANSLDYVDVYSCFPCAVQVAARELGLPLDRPLTVTGGLTFGGGPVNNYVMHSIARMTELLRESPGTHGMITANGGFLTKHAFGIYSAEPPPVDFRYEDVQPEVDTCPTREWLVDFAGDVEIETYSVMFGSDEPSIGHAACLTPDGKRTWANTNDREVLAAMLTEEFCGRPASIDGAGNLTIR